jgi:Zn-dependent protease with chaperone function
MKGSLKKKLLLFLFTVTSIGATAQLKPVYSFLKDDTVLKRNYFEKALQQKNSTVNSLSKENKEDYTKIYENRFEEVRELLTSSRSITAPEADRYLKALVQKIILANPELKGSELRVVFSRDWWPNAYSLGEGTIAVNAGLLIFLDNEAELVFILCHELAHFHLNHSGNSIKKYVETVNSEELQKELKRLSREEYKVNEQLEKLTRSLVFDSRKHSRDHEAEADREGFRMMKNTGYDCHAIISALQLLDKTDDSSFFGILNIEKAFNFNEYPFKKKWVQKESAIFSQLDETDSPLSLIEKDSLKTHPDCSKRILLLEDSINKMGSAGKLFQVNESFFKQLRKDLPAEITEECYNQRNLSRNLYYSLLFLQAGENKPMAVYSVARCLNELYQNQQQHKLGRTIDTENKRFPHDYNLLLRLLANLQLDEIASINYHFCRQYQEFMKEYTGFAGEMEIASRLKN